MKALTYSALSGVMLITGCGTTSDKQAELAYKTAMGYYQQANTAPILNIETQEGGSATWTVSGPAKVSLGTPVPPKQIIPRDPSVLSKAIEWAGRGVLGYFIADAFTSAMDTRIVTQPPAPDPIIVRPEVITVPGQ